MKLRHRLAVAASASVVACSPAAKPADMKVGHKTAEPLPLAGVDPQSAPAAGTTGQGPAPTEPATTVAVSTTSTTAPAIVVEPYTQPAAAPEGEWADDPYGNDAYRARILACIRSYEGDYTTETGNGHSGAYQFSPDTWPGAVSRAGYPKFAAGPASQAPPHVQDAAAWQLYQERGFQPWPPASKYCQSAAS